MFDSVVKFLENLATGEKENASFSYEEKLLAVSALFYRMISIDGIVRDEERAELRSVLTEKFAIEPNRLEDLIEKAGDEHRETGGLFPFVSIINHEYELEKRKEILDAMWSIAVSDGEMHEFEDNLLERAAELLEVEYVRPST